MHCACLLNFIHFTEGRHNACDMSSAPLYIHTAVAAYACAASKSRCFQLITLLLSSSSHAEMKALVVQTKQV